MNKRNITTIRDGFDFVIENLYNPNSIVDKSIILNILQQIYEEISSGKKMDDEYLFVDSFEREEDGEINNNDIQDFKDVFNW